MQPNYQNYSQLQLMQQQNQYMQELNDILTNHKNSNKMYQNINYKFNRIDRKTLTLHFMKGQIKTFDTFSNKDNDNESNGRIIGEYIITDSGGSSPIRRAVFTVKIIQVYNTDGTIDVGNTISSISIKSPGYGYANGDNILLSRTGTYEGAVDITFLVNETNTNDTDFSLNLIEPLIIDKHSDIFLEHFTTFYSVNNNTSDTSNFLLKINEFNNNNFTNVQNIMNSLIIPNEGGGTNTTKTHKAKKMNFICDINPTKLYKLTGTITDLNNANILTDKTSSFIAELVIIPRDDDE